MNLNELMLGNYVELDNPNAWLPFKNLPMLVTKIDSDLTQKEKEIWNKSNGIISLVFKHNTFSQFSEFIKPIPLTEKWLLDFGFVKDKIDNTFYKDNFEILLPSFFKYKDSILNKLKYVHQLQNLYFSLTGTHLQLVPPK